MACAVWGQGCQHGTARQAPVPSPMASMASRPVDPGAWLTSLGLGGNGAWCHFKGQIPSRYHTIRKDRVPDGLSLPLYQVPEEDQGIFRPFGKVRDVYLSVKKSSRRSRLAFIRFESPEEASKVVRLINGMHIYDWPIGAKVASLGWSKRRQRALWGHESRNAIENFRGSKEKDSICLNNVSGKGELVWPRTVDKHSFVEVTKGNRNRREELKGDFVWKDDSMFWIIFD
ncbi:hypothetical protein LWI28_020698 [Acer negundo]|uniref:RRM domain-containing protein n=1 Tax=Acer negundo TaxID=4023 RepID=A0AAD5NS02_ACENE|nr:hypothetical protein LWI28_020698 [Acer negundo]